MRLLFLCQNHCARIEHTLAQIDAIGWSVSCVSCLEHVETHIKMSPVDAFLIDFPSICGDSVAGVRVTQSGVPILYLVDESEESAFHQDGVSKHQPYILYSQVAQRLKPSVVEVVGQRQATSEEFSSMPMARENRFEFDLDNDKSRVTPTVEMLLDSCESVGLCSTADRFRLSIALEEAIVNAIVHGNLEVSSELRELGDDSYEQAIAERQQNPQYARRRVKLSCQISEQEGMFLIRDQGPGFDVSRIPDPTDDEIRHGLEGNICRCTGYQNIVKSVRWAADKMKES